MVAAPPPRESRCRLSTHPAEFQRTRKPRTHFRILTEAKRLTMEALYQQIRFPTEYHDLLLAIVEQAIHDAYISRPANTHLYAADAQRWLAGNDFALMMKAMGIDPDFARRRIRQVADLRARIIATQAT